MYNNDGAPERIYLACPYTHQDALVRRRRFIAATRCAARLCQAGVLVYSPLTHGHAMGEWAVVPHAFDFWENHCLSFLEHWATGLAVLTLDGWRESRGVAAELEAARRRDLPITYLPHRGSGYDA